MDGLRREVIEELRRQRWTVESSRKGHLKCTSPAGEVVFTGGTSRNWEAMQNWISELRRKGFRWREQKNKKRVDGRPKKSA